MQKVHIKDPPNTICIQSLLLLLWAATCRSKPFARRRTYAALLTGLSLVCFQTTAFRAAADGPADIQNDTILARFQDAQYIQDPFQPTENQEASFSRTHRVSDATKKSTVFANGIPYSWYPAVTDPHVRIIHPGVIGRKILNFAKRDVTLAKQFASDAREYGVKLPNEGMAWYYPKHIKVARMLGPDLVYSGMTMSDILGGYNGILMRSHNDPSAYRDAQQILKSLYYSWEDGGVNLADQAILEVPLFRSPPEVVLNGWLHALHHLQDYVAITEDSEAKDFLSRNIGFLADSLDQYDAPTFKLSRYSDLSPYRAMLRHKDEQRPDYFSFYLSTTEGLNDIAFPLTSLPDENGTSLYDNQILRTYGSGSQRTYVTLSCSPKFSAFLVARSKGFEVEINKGSYDWKSTVPVPNNETLHIQSRSIGDGWHAAEIPALDLICGYPTNFSKAGNKNYYHVQHIIALLYLAATYDMSVETKCTITRWALRWDQYTRDVHLPDGLSFESPQKVLDGLNAGKARRLITDADQLLQSSYRYFRRSC